MKLWPSESFVVETSMSPERVYAAFADATEPPKLMRALNWMGKRDPKTAFEGTVTARRFDVSRIVGYRNLFLPHATGTIQSCAIGSRVTIGLRLHPLTLALMVVWLGGVSIGCVGVLGALLSGAATFHPLLLIPFGMLAFGICFGGAGFWFEVPKAKRLLIAILDGPLPAPDAPPRTF